MYPMTRHVLHDRIDRLVLKPAVQIMRGSRLSQGESRGTQASSPAIRMLRIQRHQAPMNAGRQLASVLRKTSYSKRICYRCRPS